MRASSDIRISQLESVGSVNNNEDDADVVEGSSRGDVVVKDTDGTKVKNNNDQVRAVVVRWV